MITNTRFARNKCTTKVLVHFIIVNYIQKLHITTNKATTDECTFTLHNELTCKISDYGLLTIHAKLYKPGPNIARKLMFWWK